MLTGAFSPPDVYGLAKADSLLSCMQQPYLLAQLCIINVMSVYRAKLPHQGAQLTQLQLSCGSVYLSFLHSHVTHLLKSLRLRTQHLSFLSEDCPVVPEHNSCHYHNN